VSAAPAAVVDSAALVAAVPRAPAVAALAWPVLAHLPVPAEPHPLHELGVPVHVGLEPAAPVLLLLSSRSCSAAMARSSS
jgi:hypothetical protein